MGVTDGMLYNYSLGHNLMRGQAAMSWGVHTQCLPRVTEPKSDVA
jgi:hypothetical protein